MFQYIFNILITVFYSLWSLFLTIVTGKTPKVSVYHFSNGSHDSSMFMICSDEQIKTQIGAYGSGEKQNP
jgi:hypothetical protein